MIFAVVTIALIVSWFVAVLFAPLLGVWLLKKPAVAVPEQQSVIPHVPRDPDWRNAPALADDRFDADLL